MFIIRATDYLRLSFADAHALRWRCGETRGAYPRQGRLSSISSVLLLGASLESSEALHAPVDGGFDQN